MIAYFVGGGSSIRMKGRKAFPPKNTGRKDRKAIVQSVLCGVVYDDSDFRRTANIPCALDARGNKTTAAASIKFEDTIFDCQNHGVMIFSSGTNIFYHGYLVEHGHSSNTNNGKYPQNHMHIHALLCKVCAEQLSSFHTVKLLPQNAFK